MNRSKAKVIYFSKNFKISQFINFNVEQTWIVTGKRISLSRIIISPALLYSKCIIIFENDLVDNYQPPYELDRLSRFTQDQQVSLLINGRALTVEGTRSWQRDLWSNRKAGNLSS